MSVKEETDGEEEEEERASRISREGGKQSQGMVRRTFIFTFSSNVTIRDKHFLSSGILEKTVTFQSPDQNINLFHPKVKGSETDIKCHHPLSGSQKHFLRTN